MIIRTLAGYFYRNYYAEILKLNRKCKGLKIAKAILERTEREHVLSRILKWPQDSTPPPIPAERPVQFLLLECGRGLWIWWDFTFMIRLHYMAKVRGFPPVAPSRIEMASCLCGSQCKTFVLALQKQMPLNHLSGQGIHFTINPCGQT